MLQTGYDAVRETAGERLAHAGWTLQDHGDMNPGAALGVAVRLVPPGEEGPDTADYVLFVNGRAVGAVAHVADLAPTPDDEGDSGPMAGSPLPFLYREPADGTWFSSRLEPGSPARAVSAFHRPETLASWLGTDGAPALEAPYADPLLAPDRWPGVRTGYRFVAEPSPALEVYLEFRAELLAGWAESPSAATGAARLPWRLVCAQLHDPNTQVGLATTALPGDSALGDDVAMQRLLADFADAVAASLRDLERSGRDTEAEPVRCTLRADVSPADLMGHGSDLFPVATSLTLSRPATLADPVAAGDEASVTGVAAPVPPRRNAPGTRRAGDHAAPAALRDFATGFEAAFRGFDGANGEAKLATRFDAPVPGPGGAGVADTPLWGLRWSPMAGTFASFDDPAAACFALAPLARRPLDFTATVETLDAKLESSVQTLSFANLDVDLLANAFLARLEEVLALDNAVLEGLAPDAFQALVASRTQLATSIAAGLVPVFREPASAGDAAEASARVEVMALASLTATAGISAMVQAPAKVSAAGTGAVRRFVGSVGPYAGATDPVPTCTPGPTTLEGGAGPEPEPDAAAEVTSGPVSREATQRLTFPLCDPAPGDHASIDLSPVFRIRLAEHDAPDGTSTEWLRFLRPAPALDRALGAVEIPVPLRALAADPVPVRQTASRAAFRDGDDGLVERAMAWDYAAELLLPGLAAQDELWLNLEWNAPLATSSGNDRVAPLRPSDAAVLPLAEALVSFEASWLVLGPLVESLRSPASLPVDSPSAAAVMAALADRTGAVASAWQAFRPEPAGADADDAAPLEGDTFVVRFQEWPRQAVRVFATAPDLDDLVWPMLNGAGWSAPPETPGPGEAVPGPAEWLAATYPFPAAADPVLELAFQGLDATRRQTVRARCHRRRNMRLSRDPSAVTNPALLQRTPDVSFAATTAAVAGADRLGPFLSSGALSAALEPVLAQLVTACAVGAEPRSLEVTMSYRFAVGPDGDDIPVDLPILVSRLDRAEAAGAAVALAGAANAWFAAAAPSHARASLRLGYTLSAEVGGEWIPLVRLREVLYAVPPGWWEPEAASG